MYQWLTRLALTILVTASAHAGDFSGSNSVLFVSRFEIDRNLNTNPQLAEAVRRKLGSFYVAKLTRYDYSSIVSSISDKGKLYVKLCDKAVIEISYVPSLDILVGTSNTGVNFLIVNDGSPYQNLRRQCTYTTAGNPLIK